MGNVSSSEHEKFNGLLTRRAKMRVGSISRKKKQQQQQLQLQLQEEKVIKERLHTKEQICDDRPQFPSEPIPFFEPTTLNDTLHEYYYHETSSHRPTSYPESTSLTSRPIQKNQHSTKRFSESQVDLYSRLAQITSSTTSLSASLSPSQINISSPNTLELTPAHRSEPIMIPQQLSNQCKHADRCSLDTCSTDYSLSPTQRDFIHPFHYPRQCQDISIDSNASLGTSPEAKEWLKQKPTRSTAHMIKRHSLHYMSTTTNNTAPSNIPKIRYAPEQRSNYRDTILSGQSPTGISEFEPPCLPARSIYRQLDGRINGHSQISNSRLTSCQPVKHRPLANPFTTTALPPDAMTYSSQDKRASRGL